MIEKLTLSDLLDADPADPGCDVGMLLLDQYVELECAARDAAARYPELAAHLRVCSACRLDHDSLLRYVRDQR
jgi:hypothetical protein